MSSRSEWLGVCHQCFAIISFDEIGHLDLYSDLCWIQCNACEAAFGETCGVERKANPHPHSWFACPYRLSGSLKKGEKTTSASSPRTRLPHWTPGFIRGEERE